MSLRLLLAAASAVMLSPLLPSQDRDVPNPVIAEFRKYISSRDETVRRDQVQRLSRVQTVESVKLLLKHGLLDSSYLVREEAIRSLASMEDPAARQAIVRALESPHPLVREGAAMALGEIRGWRKPPVKELVALLRGERKEAVKRAAAYGLGMMGSGEATPALCEALRSSVENVVIAAADALALIRDPASAEALEPLLDHVSWRVQVAGLHAMGCVRAKRSVQPCISYMKEAKGRPREDARRALVRITRRTFGMNAGIWQEWWDRVKDTWTVPPENRKTPDESGAADGYARSRRPIRYHRITTYSKKLSFAIDISTSMLDPILLKRGRQADRAGPLSGSARKIDIAREELAHTLRGLDRTTKIYVLAFETDVRVWKREPVPATPGNVQAAIRWVERQKPRQPGSGRFGSSGIDGKGRIVGRTNTYAALRRIFGLKGDSRGSVTLGGRGPRPRWDTCFFLTDGIPTEGSTIQIPDILRDVKRWNRTARVRIHCIGMNRSAGLRLLIDGLASITGGKAVYLGR